MSLPVNSTMDQKMDFVVAKLVEFNIKLTELNTKLTELNKSVAKSVTRIDVQLRYLNAGVGTICASILSICLSTTFAQKDINKPFGQYCYSRSNNPNRESLQVTIAALAGASYSLASSSGLAATTAVLQTLAMNGHVITMMNIYSGTAQYFNKVGKSHGLSVSYISDLEGDLAEALKIREDTKLMWIESPSNPTSRWSISREWWR
ncbi:hypothetical protein TWF173_003064 [Orbilia oligospora]|nr:hypothetical protein TWF173_003064 [Orbilia oligospora]